MNFAMEGGKMDLMDKDAAWRKDPKRAAEMVVGREWAVEGDYWAELRHGCCGWIADVGLRQGYSVYASTEDDTEVRWGVVADIPDGIKSASVGLIECILTGATALPESCPGVAALKNF